MTVDFFPLSHLERESKFLRDLLVEEDNNNSSDDYVNYIPESALKVLPDTDKEIFTILFIAILVASVFLNFKAILTVSRRNYRFFQKTYIISLALSDLLTVAAFSTNNLQTFSQPYVNWSLGTFLCHFLPMAQSLGVFSSSMALLVIAMDRHRTIVKAMNKRWDPRKIYCISGCFLGWVICGCLSVPMYVNFENLMVLVVFLDKNGNIPDNHKEETLYMCVAVDKEPLRDSYIIMITFVFAPLLFIFFWFYYSIALLIWRHRKPVQVVNDRTETSTTELTVTKTPEHLKKEVLTNNKKEQMKKKLRTFKVIIILITTFIVCRLPYWAFTAIKFSYVVKGFAAWRINYLISALNVASTILNPLLYTYLNITVRVVSRIMKELNAFLCCFFSDEEFVEFEQRNIMQKEKNVKVLQMNKY